MFVGCSSMKIIPEIFKKQDNKNDENDNEDNNFLSDDNFDFLDEE